MFHRFGGMFHHFGGMLHPFDPNGPLLDVKWPHIDLNSGVFTGEVGKMYLNECFLEGIVNELGAIDIFTISSFT